MKTSISFLLASVVLVTGAHALQLTFSTTAPVPGPDDVHQLAGAANDAVNVRDAGTYADGGANDGFTYVAGDRPAQGQTFTTGGNASGYALTTIWVRHAGYTANADQTYWNFTGDGQPLTLRVTDPAQAGTAGFALATETYSFTGSEPNGPTPRTGNSPQGSGVWLRFDLATPVNLQPNTSYGFDLQFFGGAIRYFELLGTENPDATTAGGAYRGATVGSSDNTLEALTGDRVFLAGLTPLGEAPVFGDQPDSYTGQVGDSFTLQASAVSDPPPTYQWQKSSDGVTGWVDLEWAVTNTLEIFSAYYSDNGFYRVIATNANGSDTSEVAEVSLTYPPPEIVAQPADIMAEVGSNVQFTVTAFGFGNLTYQWFRDADPISGATTETLELSNVQESDGDSYWVRITDDGATADGQPATEIDSAVATLSVFPAWSGLVSHDPFNTGVYTTGSLATQNPTIAGYTDAWALTDGFGPVSPVVESTSLVYSNPLYLGSSGGSVNTPADAEGINETNAGRVGRLLEPQLVVTNTTTGTRYLSWLFRSGFENAAPNPQVYQTLALFNGALGADGNRDFEAGIAAGGGDFNTTNFAFKLDNSTGMVGDLGVPSDGSVHLFVAKIELSDQFGGDTVTVWIDPTLGSGDPAGGVTVTGADLLWDRIALSDYASDSSHWDEIRWGSSFDSVTLNPNPPDNFAAWISGFNVGSLNGIDDDADGDGIKNGLENVFGTDPSVANQGVTEVAKSGSTVTFQHPQTGVAASDLTTAYKWSADLANFHASGAADGGTTVTLTPALNTPTEGITTVTATITGTQPSKLFLTLEASQTTP